MAGYNTINTYDATARIPEFRGLMQYGDGINTDPRYAQDAVNIETPGGVLQPAAACTLLTPSLTGPIETLAILYRRWYTGDDDRNILIAASGGQLCYMLPDAEAWTLLDMPDGWEGTEYASNAWSFAAYEINPEGSASPVDVLLLSNAVDGMVMVRGDTMEVSSVATPKKFGVIERYAERIWGGAIADDPDTLAYSAPFDPTDWTADLEIPADGAGDIMQPSWDGDSFTALRAFGSQLIAFKRTRVWRILGTDPGEYTFKEQYGGGSPYFQTIAVDSERILMLSARGIVVYDGLTVQPFYQEYAKGVFDRMNLSALDQACACLWKGKYYCALPLDDETSNSGVLIYDTEANTWLLRDDVAVESFLPTESDLYFTSASTPGRIWKWQEDSWMTENASSVATRWISPWNDLGVKNLVKSGFDVYLTVETKAPTALIVSVQTERKTKTQQYVVTVPPEGKEAPQKRLHFSAIGRRFRIIIESDDNVAWRIVGGIAVVLEIDAD